MKLSIIVPVYNASPYLARCIESLLSQGLSDGDYEILLINDGSKDNSLEICQSFQLKCPNIIKVFAHDNRGVAFTRNRGITEAKGEYVAFIDADDYLISNGFSYLLSHHLSNEIDILSYQSITLDSKMRLNYKENNDVNGKILEETTGRKYLEKNIQTFVWCSLYKRSFILRHKMEFSNLVIGEDVLFNIQLFLKDPTIRRVSSNIYRYELHEDSAIHRRDKLSIRNSINSYKHLLLSIHTYALQNKEHLDLYIGLQNILSSQFIPFMSRILSSDYSILEFRELKTDLLDQGILPLRNSGKMSCIVNWMFSMPLLIKVYELLYQQLFLPYIYPNLSRN